MNNKMQNQNFRKTRKNTYLRDLSWLKVVAFVGELDRWKTENTS
jgi:hypothetical protein